MEREGEGTNLDGASKEGNGTGRSPCVPRGQPTASPPLALAPLFPVRRRRNLSLVSSLAPPPRQSPHSRALVSLSLFFPTHQILPVETSTSESTKSSHRRQQLLLCFPLLRNQPIALLQSPSPSTPIRPAAAIPPHSGGPNRAGCFARAADGCGGGIQRHCRIRLESSRRRCLSDRQATGFGGGIELHCWIRRHSSSWRRCLTDRLCFNQALHFLQLYMENRGPPKLSSRPSFGHQQSYEVFCIQMT
ncbi:uncharacterized protein [Triticum aestivum]|uniref:uncharacterized protein n=1 Tax=Triticum aestivum TaxID=4565 RepID=UPI001D019ACB|nr:uncharacterized protein LOC123089887 [Triticum aestivum]